MHLYTQIQTPVIVKGTKMGLQNPMVQTGRVWPHAWVTKIGLAVNRWHKMTKDD